MLRILSFDVERELLAPARRIARRAGKGACDLPHLLLADLERERSVLATAVPHERQPALRAGLESLGRRGPEQAGDRPVELAPAVADLLGFLAEGVGPTCLAKVLSRATAEEVHCGEMVAATVDYRPNPAAPLLAEFGLTSDTLPWTAARTPEAVLAGAAPGDETVGLVTDLTELARAGDLERAVGRQRQLQDLERVLLRKKCNNPVLVGHPNVGKTAIVEEFAHRLAEGRVAPALRGRRLLRLDVGSLVAGTKYRGEFEARLQRVLAEWTGSLQTLMFIDEIHQLLGLGRADGALDAANLLKPGLARGQLRCIGATTLEEWRWMEKDAAFERRFTPIFVPEMDPQETWELLVRVQGEYADYHRIDYREDALREVLRLAKMAHPDRRSPGREVDLLDELGALVASGANDQTPPVARQADVVRLVSLHAGMPCERLEETRAERCTRVVADLKSRVVGQSRALADLEHWLPAVAARVEPASGPLGRLLLRGPAGVGKRLAAETLAESLLGPDRLVRIDLANYRDSASRARLIGSERGLVGYEEGGELTEQVRRRPSSLVLFENIEEAHPTVANLVLETLQRGEITDSKGRTISFRGTIAVATCQAGASRRLDARWLTWAGAPIVFQPLDAAAREEILDRTLASGLCRWLAAADPSPAELSASTERAGRDRAIHVRRGGDSCCTMRIAGRAISELLCQADDSAASVVAVADCALSRVLGRAFLHENALPQEFDFEPPAERKAGGDEKSDARTGRRLP